MLNFPRLFASPAESTAYPSRRSFLARAGGGFGMLALADLLRAEENPTLRWNPLAPRPPHFPAKAKSRHLAVHERRPEPGRHLGLQARARRSATARSCKGFDKNTGFFTDQVGPLMKSPFKFSQHGQCGDAGSRRSSRTWPGTSTRWRSSTRCCTESNNHSPALFKINTGMTRMGFPCVGSWVTYGLGSESQNLPGVRRHVRHARPRPAQGARAELGRRLPARRLPGHRAQAAGRRRSTTSTAPDGHDRRRSSARQLDLLSRAQPAAPASSTRRGRAGGPRSRRFELAYRMQMAAPEALDVDTRDRGDARSSTASTTRSATHFAKQCLIARRLVERGVRFVQIYSRRHGERAELGRPHRHRQEPRAASPARPTSRSPACSTDLKQRGLLDSTLVIWGGEFGRLPIVQKGEHRPRPQPARLHDLDGRRRRQGRRPLRRDRRDRLQGRRRPRQRQRPARDDPAPARPRPPKLTYRYNGRDFRLTDVAGNVVKDILK